MELLNFFNSENVENFREQQIKTETGLQFHCTKCDYDANAKEGLDDHIRDNHVFANFFSFIQSKNEIKTEEYVDQKDENKFEPKNYKEETTDVNKDSENIPKCESCDFKTISLKLLETHKKSVHDGFVRFGCSLCDFKSYFISSTKNHLKQHEGEDSRLIRIGCSSCENHEDHNCKELNRILKKTDEESRESSLARRKKKLMKKNPRDETKKRNPRARNTKVH